MKIKSIMAMLVVLSMVLGLVASAPATEMPLKVYYDCWGGGLDPGDSVPWNVTGPWYGLDTGDQHRSGTSGTEYGGSPLTVGDIKVMTDSSHGEDGSLSSWICHYSPYGQWTTDGQTYPMLDLANGPVTTTGSYVDPWLELIFEGLTAGTQYEITIFHNNPYNDLGSGVSISGSGGGAGSGTGTNGTVSKQATTLDDAGQTTWTWTSDGGTATIRTEFDSPGPWQNGFILQTVYPKLAFASAASSALESVSPAQIEVKLNNGEPGETYTVDYSVVGGTATKGDDYVLTEPNTMTFNPGETSKTIDIDIINDGLNEPDETIVLQLSNPTGPEAVLVDPNQHTYTIIDPRPAVSFGTDSSKDFEDIGSVSIPVHLSRECTETMTVDYDVSGTATGGGVDYTMLGTGTLTFDPCDTTENIEISVVDDGFDELNETIVISLRNFVDTKPGAVTEYTYTILDPSQIHLKVDLAHPKAEGSNEPRAGTAKEGWTGWAAPAWWDMYMHDMQTIEDINGTAINAALSMHREGNGALLVYGMCLYGKAGGGPPSGSPVGDPIANTWYCNFDFGGNPQGNVVLSIYGMPPGTYTLKSYHNWWVFCDGDTRECWDCTPSMPPMPRVWAIGLIDAESLGLYGYDKMVSAAENDGSLGNPGGVELIQDATNVDYSTTTNDDEVATSEISFWTDGSAVLVIYEAPHGWTDPRGRDGGRGILNAFELKHESTPADINLDGIVNFDDYADLIQYWMSEDCGAPDWCDYSDLNKDGTVNMVDLKIFVMSWLEGGM